MDRLISWSGVVRGRVAQGEFIAPDDATEDEIEMLVESDAGGAMDGEWMSQPYRPEPLPEIN